MEKFNLFSQIKPHNIIDLAKLPFLASPFFSVVIIIQKILNGIIPTFMILATSYFINTAIDIFNDNEYSNRILLPLAVIIALTAVQVAFELIASFANKKLDIEVRSKIQLKGIEHIATLDYVFIENQDYNLTSKRVMESLAGNISVAFSCMFQIVETGIRLLGIYTLFWTMGMWWLGLIIVILSIPISLIAYKTSMNVYHLFREYYPGGVELYQSESILKERYTARERSLFGYSSSINAFWWDKQTELNNKKNLANKKIVISKFISKIFMCAILSALVFALTYFTINGDIAIGEYIALVGGLITLTNFIHINSNGLAGSFADIKGFLKELNEFCSYSSNPEYLAAHTDKNNISFESITFKNVSFKYPFTERLILNNVSFTIQRGKRYALVGKNGAGKSTIIKLMTCLYSNYEGDIYINQKNLRDYSQSEIKSFFSSLYQDFARYEMSLLDNVNIGNLNISDKKKRQELYTKLDLTKMIKSLPHGEYTHLGKLESDGQDISGGEWQRVALARMLFRDAPVYILDEPTAALDPEGECNFYQLFNKVTENKTAILISHRLGSIKNVNHIFVLDNGTICEQGSHEELVRANGLYAKMYGEQQGWYLNED